MKIGFIGLGNMGQPMALNLVQAGHNLKVFDLQKTACEPLLEAGASGCDQAQDTVTDADVVITMLPAGTHVKGLYLEQGLLDRIQTETLVIDCSTIDPESARLVAMEAKSKGITMLDAPVSGGTKGAQAGTLTFIVGGPTEAMSRARDVLGDMGKNIFHAGEHGAGQVAKICNNMALAIQMIGTSEALAMGVANGLDAKVLSNIMQSSSASNWVLNCYNPWPGVMADAPASHQYQGGFTVDLMTKDLGLAEQTAATCGAVTPLGQLARALYQLHQRDGAGALDFSSIQKVFQEPEVN